MRVRQRGSITLEMVLAIPVVFMLIWSGTVLSISASSRASLQMTAMRAARELAVTDAGRRLGEDQLYEYEEFTETYSLPRPKVKMLVVNHGGIIVAGACYRVRLDLPALGKRPSPIPEPLKPVVDYFVPEDLVSDFEDLAHDTAGAWDQPKKVFEQGLGLWESIRQFRPATGAKAEFVDHEQRYTSLQQFDEAVKARCGGRNILLAEHAGFWSEKSEEPPADDNLDDGQEENNDRDVASLDLMLDPKAVNIPADASPINMPQVTATAIVVPADAQCTIEVVYSSGPSQASGLESPTITTTVEHTVYQWAWNVGTNTTSGDWPVTVTCTNNKSATVHLDVTARDSKSGG